MTFPLFKCALTALAALCVCASQAQSPRLPTPATKPQAAAVKPQQAADFIVAIVNSEPITNNDVREESKRIAQQLAQQQGMPQPSAADIANEALEILVRKKALMQAAVESGVRVTENEIDQAAQNVALQNKLSVPEMYKRLAADGVSASQFRKQVREQLTLTRAREREVDSKVRVSESDVDQFLEGQKSGSAVANQDINLAHILIAVPDSATEVQVQALQARAQRTLVRVRAGENFEKLVEEISDASDKISGGQLGLRNASRYPPLFVDAVSALATGGVSDVIRSGAGFHILKVIEKRASGQATKTFVQSHARHILLRTSPSLSEAAVRARLENLRKRAVEGKADFADLARQNSQDGSAAQGGDLGWASPGQFVPEFEVAMNALAPGQISPPIVSRFGVHLIQLIERRTATMTAREEREAVRGMLRDKKMEEAVMTWERDVRARAYVDLREPPQ